LKTDLRLSHLSGQYSAAIELSYLNKCNQEIQVEHGPYNGNGELYVVCLYTVLKPDHVTYSEVCQLCSLCCDVV